MRPTLYLLLTALVSFLVFVAAYAVKRQLFPADFALRESIGVMLALLPFLAAALWLLCRRQILRPDGAAAVLLIFLLAVFGFTLTVPAVFDRSVSLYLLNTLDNRVEQGMTEPEIKREFLQVYFGGNYALRKRLREQTATGYLIYQDNRYYITGSGRRFVGLARRISRWFNLDPRIVAPASRE